jgi:hypothetical protein
METHFDEPFSGSLGIEERKVHGSLINHCPVGGIRKAS